MLMYLFHIHFNAFFRFHFAIRSNPVNFKQNMDIEMLLIYPLSKRYQ